MAPRPGSRMRPSPTCASCGHAATTKRSVASSLIERKTATAYPRPPFRGNFRCAPPPPAWFKWRICGCPSTMCCPTLRDWRVRSAAWPMHGTASRGAFWARPNFAWTQRASTRWTGSSLSGRWPPTNWSRRSSPTWWPRLGWLWMGACKPAGWRIRKSNRNGHFVVQFLPENSENSGK